MTTPATPPDNEVQQWLTRDPGSLCPRSAVAWARFWVIRRYLLWPLVRDPGMWVLQGRKMFRGLGRLGLFLGLAPPVLAFWEPVVWPAVVGVGFLGLVLLDLLLGCRLSRFQNVFVDKAERLAWAVVDAEPPGSSTEHTKRTMEHEERERC